MSNAWIKLAVPAPDQGVAALEDALVEAGALAVSVEALDDSTPRFALPGVAETELWPNCIVEGLFDASVDIEAVLAASGATLADVVKINYFLADIRELPHEIAVRQTLFPADRMPAVTAVQVASLGLPGLLMEVDIIAVVPRG